MAVKSEELRGENCVMVWVLMSISRCRLYVNGVVLQLSVAPLIAQAIYNIHQKKSISALFK